MSEEINHHRRRFLDTAAMTIAAAHFGMFEIWIRRALGVAVIMGVAAIAIGWDTNLLTKSSFVNTAKAEEHLIGAFDSERPAVLIASAAESHPVRANEGPLPDLGGAIGWLNSAPLNRKSLRGKVVLVDFWTYLHQLSATRAVRKELGGKT
jgi:hypothetical protein